MSEFNKDFQLRTMRAALEQIATGEIVGEQNNHRDTLAICRSVASKALEVCPPEVGDER